MIITDKYQAISLLLSRVAIIVILEQYVITVNYQIFQADVPYYVSTAILFIVL